MPPPGSDDVPLPDDPLPPGDVSPLPVVPVPPDVADVPDASVAPLALEPSVPDEPLVPLAPLVPPLSLGVPETAPPLMVLPVPLGVPVAAGLSELMVPSRMPRSGVLDEAELPCANAAVPAPSKDTRTAIGSFFMIPPYQLTASANAKGLDPALPAGSRFFPAGS